MTGAAIEMRSVVKRFGAHRALDGLDLDIERGSVTGFLGPNGAGKTTAVRILLGLARPTEGGVRVLGTDVAGDTSALRARIGYLPDVPGFSPWMTAKETLEFCADLFGLAATERRARVGALLDMAGLAGVPDRVGGYSRGMKQRLGLAQALINAPELLVLDEPTSALDPLGRRSVLELIDALRGRTTVFFSTHILADVERVCDAVAIVDRGRVRAQGPLHTVLGRSTPGARVLVEVDRPDALRAALAAEPWVGSVVAEERDGRPVLIVDGLDAAAARAGIPRVIAALGLGLDRLESVEPSLEDVFVRLVEADR